MIANIENALAVVRSAGQLPVTWKNTDECAEEILGWKNTMGLGAYRIGQALNWAKEQLSHGEWGTWLRERVDFSPSTAQNFMRIAREVDESSSLARLPYTKVLALLELPADQRESFAQANDVEDKSAAEIRRLIHEKEEMERKITRLESTNQLQAEKLSEKREELQAAQDAAGAAEQQIAKLQDKLKRREGDRDSLHKQVLGLIDENNKLRSQEPTIIREVPEDYEQLKRKAKAAEEEADRLADELDRLKTASAQQEMNGGGDVTTRILSAMGGMMVQVGRIPAQLTEGSVRISKKDGRLVVDKILAISAWCKAMLDVLGVEEGAAS